MNLGSILWVAGGLSAIGLLGLFLRKNLVIMLMSLELILLGAVLALVGAGRLYPVAGVADSALFVPFVLVVAAAEVCIGLSLVMVIFRHRHTFWVDELDRDETRDET